MAVSAQTQINIPQFLGLNRRRHHSFVAEFLSGVLYRKRVRQIGINQDQQRLIPERKPRLAEPEQGRFAGRQLRRFKCSKIPCFPSYPQHLFSMKCKGGCNVPSHPKAAIG